MNQQNIIKSIRHLANKILPKDAKIILFGSRARGTEREDSDWDLLILLNKQKRSLADIDNYGYPFKELGWNLQVEINPIVSTYSDMDEHQHHSLLYQNINTEGILLWE